MSTIIKTLDNLEENTIMSITKTTYKNLRIMFTNSYLPLSPVIRFVTWSKYSHMVIVINDNYVIHSDFNGVHIEPIVDLMNRSKSWMIVEYECKNSQAIINEAIKLLNRPYDYGALIGIAIRRIELQDDSKYVCSEFPAAACQNANDPFFCTDYLHRITPQHWLMLPHTVIYKSHEK